MQSIHLSPNEQLAIYNITRHPHLTDSENAELTGLKLSTFTAIKRRLQRQGRYRIIALPALDRLGCELLTFTHTDFNPVIPLEDRIKTTTEAIEIFDEIFFSIGEQERGFSLALSKNYTDLGRINDMRAMTFGAVGLLEDKYPEEIIYPLQTSSIDRFFDFTRSLADLFGMEESTQGSTPRLGWFDTISPVQLSAHEKKVLAALVEHPMHTTQQLGEMTGLSRHTISRMKQGFQQQGLLRYLAIPDVKALGYHILAVYHIKLDLQSTLEKDLQALDTPSTIFLAKRQFELTIISIYGSYHGFKEDMMVKIRYLKEHNLIRTSPKITEYSLDRSIIIKPFDFAPITRSLLNLE